MVKLDDLPCDIWLYVLKYGGLEEALKVYDISQNLQRACCETMRNRLISLLYDVAQGIPKMQIKLKQSPVADQSLRYSIMYTIVFLRYLLTEINILFNMVWRYSSNYKAWIFLGPYLLPVIQEFDNLFHSSINPEFRQRKLRLSTYNINRLLDKYHDFTNKFDNELEEKLLKYTSFTDIETKALDILLSCPSINFQLCLSRTVGDKCLYNISSFFGFNNLNSSFKPLDIYKKKLPIVNQKSRIIKFLRECVQYENISFLQSITNDIVDLELSLEVANDINFQLFQNLYERYEKILDTPYSPIFCNCSITETECDKTINEHYHKCVTYNQDITGLTVLINIANQPSENIPYIVHSFRGKRKPLLDERVLQLVGKQPCFLDCSSKLTKPVRHSLQLCMNYWQGFNPSQTVIDVFYDQTNECCISSNNIKFKWDITYDIDEDMDT